MRLPTRKKELERMMSEEPDLHFTQEKINAMKRELEHLETSERKTAAAEVIRTGEMGDFSENAGYQWAKQNLRRINSRILSLTEKINHAIVIIPDKSSTRVRIGSTVTIQLNTATYTYEILGSQESDPMKGRISHLSPIGKALLGAQVGDEVPVTHGGNTITYIVLAIS